MSSYNDWRDFPEAVTSQNISTLTRTTTVAYATSKHKEEICPCSVKHKGCIDVQRIHALVCDYLLKCAFDAFGSLLKDLEYGRIGKCRCV